MITFHGYIQGYNSQALVGDKHQVVVHAEAFGTVSDHEHVAPMMQGAKENMQSISHDEDYFRGAIFVADTNYHSQFSFNLHVCILDAAIMFSLENRNLPMSH
jgi:hypothetical protein